MVAHLATLLVQSQFLLKMLGVLTIQDEIDNSHGNVSTHSVKSHLREVIYMRLFTS